MKQSDPLELVEAGSLARSGPVGRFVRLVLGLGCLYALWQVSVNLETVVAAPATAMMHPNFALLTTMCFGIISYVVNIGFSKSWGRRPAYLSLAGMLAFALIGFVVAGDFDNPVLGIPLFAWLCYFYGHLGISFVVAALIATPGCEMRAMPELIGRLTGHAALEHHCPSSFITKIDDWERRTSSADLV